MSYSVESSCRSCKKSAEGCLDEALVQGAVNTIHSVNYIGEPESPPHKGGGSIVIKCFNLDPIEAEPGEK